MIIYLAHAKANYASANDGYVNALRFVEHRQTLYSFHFLEGAQRLPITNENLHGVLDEQGLDGHGLRPQPPGSGDS